MIEFQKLLGQDCYCLGRFNALANFISDLLVFPFSLQGQAEISVCALNIKEGSLENFQGGFLLIQGLPRGSITTLSSRSPSCAHRSSLLKHLPLGGHLLSIPGSIHDTFIEIIILKEAVAILQLLAFLLRFGGLRRSFIFLLINLHLDILVLFLSFRLRQE